MSADKTITITGQRFICGQCLAVIDHREDGVPPTASAEAMKIAEDAVSRASLIPSRSTIGYIAQSIDKGIASLQADLAAKEAEIQAHLDRSDRMLADINSEEARADAAEARLKEAVGLLDEVGHGLTSAAEILLAGGNVAHSTHLNQLAARCRRAFLTQPPATEKPHVCTSWEFCRVCNPAPPSGTPEKGDFPHSSGYVERRYCQWCQAFRCSRPVPYTGGKLCVLEVDHREPCTQIVITEPAPVDHRVKCEPAEQERDECPMCGSGTRENRRIPVYSEGYCNDPWHDAKPAESQPETRHAFEKCLAHGSCATGIGCHFYPGESEKHCGKPASDPVAHFQDGEEKR